MSTFSPVVVVQGGAGTHAAISQDSVRLSAVHDGIRNAARHGYRVLDDGGSALDAVQAAVVSMEDDPTFNCG